MYSQYFLEFQYQANDFFLVKKMNMCNLYAFTYEVMIVSEIKPLGVKFEFW